MADLANLRRVALALPLGVPHLERTVNGISHYANQHGKWRLAMSPDSLVLSVQDLRGWTGDGIIARINTQAEAQAVAQLEPSVVNVSGVFAESPVPRVTVDNLAVGRTAAEHLLQRGFARFAYYGVKGMWYAQLRGEGFVEASEQAGGTCDVFEGQSSFEGGWVWDKMDEELQAWLSSLSPPVGLFACNDYRARMVLEACGWLGLRVPDDVSVLGVNNDEIACECCEPPLSSVSCEAEHAGYAAAEMLDALMDGRKLPQKQLLIAPGSVVERRSTDTLEVEDTKAAEALQYVRDHLDEQISVADVTRHMDVSRRWLERAFRESVGRTPGEYISHARIERAKRLLDGRKEMTLKRVARLCGFSSVKRLRAAFERFTGISLRQYREQHENKKGGDSDE